MDENTHVNSHGTHEAASQANTFLRKNIGKLDAADAHAIRVLIAAAVQNPDYVPKLWHCDTYCRKVRHVTCEGEFCAEEGAVNPCPYLDEMLY